MLHRIHLTYNISAVYLKVSGKILKIFGKKKGQYKCVKGTQKVTEDLLLGKIKGRMQCSISIMQSNVIP